MVSPKDLFLFDALASSLKKKTPDPIPDITYSEPITHVSSPPIPFSKIYEK